GECRVLDQFSGADEVDRPEAHVSLPAWALLVNLAPQAQMMNSSSLGALMGISTQGPSKRRRGRAHDQAATLYRKDIDNAGDQDPSSSTGHFRHEVHKPMLVGIRR